jgi:hypothetical protein
VIRSCGRGVWGRSRKSSFFLFFYFVRPVRLDISHALLLRSRSHDLAFDSLLVYLPPVLFSTRSRPLLQPFFVPISASSVLSCGVIPYISCYSHLPSSFSQFLCSHHRLIKMLIPPSSITLDSLSQIRPTTTSLQGSHPTRS